MERNSSTGPGREELASLPTKTVSEAMQTGSSLLFARDRANRSQFTEYEQLDDSLPHFSARHWSWGHTEYISSVGRRIGCIHIVEAPPSRLPACGCIGKQTTSKHCCSHMSTASYRPGASLALAKYPEEKIKYEIS